MKTQADFQIRPARVEDAPIILELIRDLARYERALDEVTAQAKQSRLSSAFLFHRQNYGRGAGLG